MKKLKAAKTKVWLTSTLGGKVKIQVFSLSYMTNDGQVHFTDLGSFRPDPSDFLKPDRTYDAKLEFKTETGYDNIDRQVLRKVSVMDSKGKIVAKFAQIR